MTGKHLAAWLTGVVVVLSIAAPARAVTGVDWMPIWKPAIQSYWAARTDPGLLDGDMPAACPAGIGIDWSPLHGRPTAASVAVHDDPCHITIDTVNWHAMPEPTYRCVMLTHEIGHVYGHTHAEGGVMTAWMDDAPSWKLVPPCRATIAAHRTRAGWAYAPRAKFDRLAVRRAFR